MIKRPIKIIADRVFSRAKIARMEKEVVASTRKLNHIEHEFESSAMLLDKKMQYLLAKLDAYAEAADAIDSQMREDASRRHKAIETRLDTVEAGYVANLPSLGEDFVKSTKSIEASLTRLQADRQADMAAFNEAIAQQIASSELRHVAVEAGVTASIATLSERVVENQQTIDGLMRLHAEGQDELKDLRGIVAEQFASVDAHLRTVEAREAHVLKTITAMQKASVSRVSGSEAVPIVPATDGQPTVRIEILGPSGVGKSSILNAAKSLRTEDLFWHGPTDIDAALDAAQIDRQSQRDALDSFAPQDFVAKCLEIVADSSMLPSQKISAYAQFRGTCYAAFALRALSSATPLVHDELLLHRASSLLLYSDAFEQDAAWYFDTVPVPDAAIIVLASRDEIFARTKARKTQPINTYYGLDDVRLADIIDRSIHAAHIAHDRLTRRGVKTMMIDASRSIETAGAEMQGFIVECHTREHTSKGLQ